MISAIVEAPARDTIKSLSFNKLIKSSINGTILTLYIAVISARTRVTSKDATGKEMPIDATTYIPSEDGANLVLTIDSRIQYIIEKYLKQALEDNNPTDYGTAIVMNPKNGDILAMATMPDFDPNSPHLCVIKIN